MKLTMLAIALGAVATTTLVTAGPATAAHKDGVCEGGEVCLFRQLNGQGAVWDSAASYGPDENFSQPLLEVWHSGAAAAQPMNNDAKSARNKNGQLTAIFYRDVQFGGPAQAIYNGYGDVNLNSSLAQKQSSMRWTE